MDYTALLKIDIYELIKNVAHYAAMPAEGIAVLIIINFFLSKELKQETL